jgi:hypothetical protein
LGIPNIADRSSTPPEGGNAPGQLLLDLSPKSLDRIRERLRQPTKWTFLSIDKLVAILNRHIGGARAYFRLAPWWSTRPRADVRACVTSTNGSGVGFDDSAGAVFVAVPSLGSRHFQWRSRSTSTPICSANSFAPRPLSRQRSTRLIHTARGARSMQQANIFSLHCRHYAVRRTDTYFSKGALAYAEGAGARAGLLAHDSRERRGQAAP